jgi:hypothetical protein
MKLNVLALALAATAFGTLSGSNAASAQAVIQERSPGLVVEERPVVIERQQGPVVIEQAPASSVTTEERGGFLGTEKKTTTETVGTGPNGDCTTRTTHREDLGGEKTVSRTDCP